MVTFATGFSIYEGMRNWKTRNDNPAGDDEDDIPKIISIEKNTSDVGPQGNKIYFYSDVTRDTVLNLNRQIDELTKQMKSVQFNFSLPELQAGIYFIRIETIYSVVTKKVVFSK